MDFPIKRIAESSGADVWKGKYLNGFYVAFTAIWITFKIK